MIRLATNQEGQIMSGRSKSEDGSESAGEMNPPEPSQAELDKDRAENKDISDQVGGAERDAGGGGGE